MTTQRDGSFPSVAAATKLVNSTLARNREIVGEVANGALPDAFLKATFLSKTGIEAYRSSPYSVPYLRDTYGVGVYIIHDPHADTGFLVVTAYPRQD